MGDLEDLFNSAASYVQDQSISENGKKLDQTQLLELYGLYKSATIGPCNESRPGKFIYVNLNAANDFGDIVLTVGCRLGSFQGFST